MTMKKIILSIAASIAFAFAAHAARGQYPVTDFVGDWVHNTNSAGVSTNLLSATNQASARASIGAISMADAVLVASSNSPAGAAYAASNNQWTATQNFPAANVTNLSASSLSVGSMTITVLNSAIMFTNATQAGINGVFAQLNSNTWTNTMSGWCVVTNGALCSLLTPAGGTAWTAAMLFTNVWTVGASGTGTVPGSSQVAVMSGSVLFGGILASTNAQLSGSFQGKHGGDGGSLTNVTAQIYGINYATPVAPYYIAVMDMLHNFQVPIPLSSFVTNNGSGASLSNLSGANITAGTVNSNALDAATKAMLGGSGGNTNSGVPPGTILTNVLLAGSGWYSFTNGSIVGITNPSTAQFIATDTATMNRITSGTETSAGFYGNAFGPVQWNRSTAIQGAGTKTDWIEDWSGWPFGTNYPANATFNSSNGDNKWYAFGDYNIIAGGKYVGRGLGGFGSGSFGLGTITNIPGQWTNLAGTCIIVYGSVSTYAAAQNQYAGFQFGFVTNGASPSYQPSMGFRYSPTPVVFTPVTYTSQHGLMASYFQPDKVVGLKVEAITNGFLISGQGGVWSDSGCTVGSANWFPIYQYLTGNSYLLTNLCIAVGGIVCDGGVTVQSINAYTNTPTSLDSRNASMVDSEVDARLNCQAPSTILDPVTGFVCASVGVGTNDSSADMTPYFTFKNPVNGFWLPKVAIATPPQGSSTTNMFYQNETLAVLGGQLVDFYSRSTNGFASKMQAVWKTVTINPSSYSVTLGPETAFNITNAATVFTNANSVNFAIAGKAIITADGAEAVSAGVWDTNNLTTIANVCLKTFDHGTNWAISGIIESNLNNFGGESCVSLEANGVIGCWMNSTTAGYYSSSADNGATWSTPTVVAFQKQMATGKSGNRQNASALPGGYTLVTYGEDAVGRSRLTGAICWTNAQIVSKFSILNSTNTGLDAQYPQAFVANGLVYCIHAASYYASGLNKQMDVHHYIFPLDNSWRAQNTAVEKAEIGLMTRAELPNLNQSGTNLNFNGNAVLTSGQPGNASGLTNLNLGSINWTNSMTAVVTNTIAWKVPVATNAGITLYLLLTTNAFGN